jgi:hypothetical protein
MRTGQLEMQLGMDAAIDRAWDWAEEARYAIEHSYKPGERFTADDLRGPAGDPPAHGDALGAVLRNAYKAKLIRPVGYVTSTRPDAHGRVIREWVRT